MGLKCSNSINYSIVNIDFKSLLEIYHSRSGRRASSLTDAFPIIDFGASWIIRRCSLPPVARINYLMSIAMLFVKNGCCVDIICDGETRYHMKISTTKRTADFYRQSVDYQYAKCKLLSLTRDLNTKYFCTNEREDMLKEKDLLR